MLAERLPGILPPLTRQQALEATAIHSVAGELPPGVGLLTAPPFRAPHHTASASAVVGGGSGRPGPGRSAWRTTACCSSTRHPSSPPASSTACASRWSRGAWCCTGPGGRSTTRRGSSSSWRRTRARAAWRPRPRTPVPARAAPAVRVAAVRAAPGPDRPAARDARGDPGRPARRARLGGEPPRWSRPGSPPHGSGWPRGWPAPRGGSTPRCPVPCCGGLAAALGGGGRCRATARPGGADGARVDRVLRVAWTLADLAGRDKPGRRRRPRGAGLPGVARWAA